jgi:hypothetical protein
LLETCCAKLQKNFIPQSRQRETCQQTMSKTNVLSRRGIDRGVELAMICIVVKTAPSLSILLRVVIGDIS